MSLFSQETKMVTSIFKHLSTKDGLSNSSITDVIQDQDGFIWFATLNGINRYDGYSIKSYKQNNDTIGLKSYYILKLFIDSQSRLWAATNLGAGIYSKEHDKFIDLLHITGNPVRINQVEDIIEDSKGAIWLATTSGLFKYEPDINTLEQIIPKTAKAFPYAYISELELNGEGSIYLSAQDGLYLFDPSTYKCSFIAQIGSANYHHGEIKEFIVSMVTDSSENLWIGSSIGNIYTFNTAKNTLTELQEPKTSVIGDIQVADDSTLYIGLDINGLIRFNTKTHNYEGIYDEYNPNKQIGNGKIRTVFVDRQNILWVGHFTGGLSFTQLNQTGFGQVSYKNSADKRIRTNTVSAILKDRHGYLWVGIDGNGIIRYFPNSQKYELFKNEPGNPYSLPNDAVLSIFEDSKGRVWVGSYRGGLSKYEPETNTFISYKHDENNPNSIGGNDVRSITEDADGNLWLVCHGIGFSKFSPQTGNWKNFMFLEDGSNSLVNNWSYDLSFDINSDLWITTTAGLSRYDTVAQRFYNYTKDFHDLKSLPSNLVYCTFCDSRGRLWFGTDQGLVEYFYGEDAFEFHNTNDGNANESILSINDDPDGNLWLGTNNGLICYNPIAKQHRKFTMSDGLQGDEFMRACSYTDSAGVMYFGGLNGFNYFSPEDIKLNTEPPKVVITQIELMGRLLRQCGQGTEHAFAHNQNFISFSYVALNFKSAEKNRYRYILDGLEENWHDETEQRKAVYTSLPPGSYTFRVIACNNDGVWNREGVHFSFTVLPPWYARWWFRITAFISIILIIVLFFYIRLWNVKKQNILLEQKVGERTKELQEKNEEIASQRDELEELNKTKDKFFSIISHDLKNPLNAMIGFADLLNRSYDTLPDEKKKRFVSIIFSSSKSLFALLENLLHWSRSQSGTIAFSPKQIPADAIIKETMLTLEQHAAKKGIALNYTPQARTLVYADENMLKTVVRNILSNAIKFTPFNGKITISVTETEEIIGIRIQDTGVGMTPEQLEALFKIGKNNSTKGTDSETGTGLGMVLCKEFIDRHKGKIWAESKKNEGSTFFVELLKN